MTMAVAEASPAPRMALRVFLIVVFAAILKLGAIGVFISGA
jgi:hypothetical protein